MTFWEEIIRDVIWLIWILSAVVTLFTVVILLLLAAVVF